jgi:hypothetical protein
MIDCVDHFYLIEFAIKDVTDKYRSTSYLGRLRKIHYDKRNYPIVDVVADRTQSI